MTMIPAIQQWKAANILQFPAQGQSTASVNLCRHKEPNARLCCAESEKRDTVGGAAVSHSIFGGIRMTMKALTDEQRKFAEENHDLIYAFLKENSLPVVQYYDVVVFGYLCAVQEYCENPKLQTFAFATLAWKRMRREVFNYRKYLSKDVGSHATTMYLQDIQYDRISENLVCKQDELMVQLETELILHALAKKLPSKEMRIIRMKLDGAGMHDIAKAERITFHDIKQLLAGTYDTVVQVLLG